MPTSTSSGNASLHPNTLALESFPPPPAYRGSTGGSACATQGTASEAVQVECDRELPVAPRRALPWAADGLHTAPHPTMPLHILRLT